MSLEKRWFFFLDEEEQQEDEENGEEHKSGLFLRLHKIILLLTEWNDYCYALDETFFLLKEESS